LKIFCSGINKYKGENKLLIKAGIKRAKGVVCVLPSEAENVYVILTAKELNQHIYYIPLR
jgi:voltage-gated potassium channel